jgi:hypothetical protein
MIDAARGGVQRFSYNRCDPHVAQRHNRAIRINRNLKHAVIVKEPAIVRVDGRKKDLLTCGDAPPAPLEAHCATGGPDSGRDSGRDLSESPTWSRTNQGFIARWYAYQPFRGAGLPRSNTNFARGIYLKADTFASFALFKFDVGVICGD